MTCTFYRMKFLSFFLLTSSLGAQAWPNFGRAQPNRPPSSELDVQTQTDSDAYGYLMSPKEMESIFLHKDSLGIYSSKPDCFKAAAAKLKVDCRELDMHEVERVKGAISMTLCELATASRHSIPLECVPFASGTSLPDAAPDDCVQALSRSAQFWSSYSGYLREIPQLCLAFGRWNDIDIAKEIYKNATREKVALLQLLSSHEKERLNHLHLWNERLEVMRNIVGDLQKSAESVELRSRAVEQSTIRGLNLAFTEFEDLAVRIRHSGEEVQSRLAGELAVHLSEVSERHRNSLNGILPELGERISVLLDKITSMAHSRSTELSNLSDRIITRWARLESEVSTMGEAVISLSARSYEAETVFIRSLEQAQEAHRLQLGLVDSSAALSTTLEELTTMAHHELKRINESALTVQETLRFTAPPVIDLVGLVQWIQTFWSFNPVALSNLGNVPAFRVLLILAKFGVYAINMLFSSIISALLFLVSTRRYLVKKSAFSQGCRIESCSTTPPPTTTYQSSLQSRLTSSGRVHGLQFPNRLRLSGIPDRLCEPETPK